MPTSKARRLRKWFLGVLVAAFTAAFVQAMTGAFSKIGSSMWTLFMRQGPVQVTVASDFVSFSRSGHALSYLIPRPIDQIPPSPIYLKDPPEKFEEWAGSLGAVDGRKTVVNIIVTGRSDTPVILTNLRVTVKDRRPPLPGIYVRLPGGGPISRRYFDVNLDASPPTIESADEVDDRPAEFPYKVSATEPEVFLINAHTETCDCTWVAELFWTAGDKKGSTIIDNNGKPFRTTSIKDAPIYYFGGGELKRSEP